MAPMKGSNNKAKLDGKIAVITGANTGIGKETALDLSKRGAKIVILCRNVDKGKAAAEEISKLSKNDEVEVVRLDLASLSSVRECAEELNGRLERIDLLVNNAGVMMCPYQKTADGLEMQIGTNHFGHFLLTELLLPLLKKSSLTGFRPRIVIVSSVAHEWCNGIRFDDINWERGYNDRKAYGMSKLANILHAKELAKRLQGTGICVYSLHPGVVNTELSRHITQKWYGPVVKPFLSFIKTPLQGAQTSLYCCLEESILNDSGKYYSGCKEKTPHRMARNEESQKMLWELSEKIVGINNSSSGDNASSAKVEENGDKLI